MSHLRGVALIRHQLTAQWAKSRIFRKLEIEFLSEISQFSSLRLLKIIFFQNLLSANTVGKKNQKPTKQKNNTPKPHICGPNYTHKLRLNLHDVRKISDKYMLALTSLPHCLICDQLWKASKIIFSINLVSRPDWNCLEL